MVLLHYNCIYYTVTLENINTIVTNARKINGKFRSLSNTEFSAGYTSRRGEEGVSGPTHFKGNLKMFA